MSSSFYALRRDILLTVILIATTLGVPLWYMTTSVYRADLPEAEIDNLNRNIVSRVHYEVPIYVLNVPTPLDGLIDEAQSLIDNKVASYASPVEAKFKLIKADSSEVAPDSYKIELVSHEPDDDRAEALYISMQSDRLIKIYLSPDVIAEGQVSDFIMRVVTQDLFGSELKMLQRIGQDHQGDYNLVRLPYSPHYKVSISFLQESDNPIDWKVEQVTKQFERYLSVLKEFANFTVETQVSLYESLPETAQLEVDGDQYTLKDTSTFMDYSEWGLDQDVEAVPSINLVVYVPDSEKHITIPNSKTNSFIVPQWGGVVIHNNEKKFRLFKESKTATMGQDQLQPIFDIFASQLFQLLGAPSHPKSPYIRADILTRWQSVENLLKSVDNLVSLQKLTGGLNTIPIPEITLQEAEETMRLVDQSVSIIDDDTTNNWWVPVNVLSSKALQLSDKAFFQKDMVQQVYFPDEHKMAVYMPLLGPFATIVVLALIRLARERKVEQREKENCAEQN